MLNAIVLGISSTSKLKNQAKSLFSLPPLQNISSEISTARFTITQKAKQIKAMAPPPGPYSGTSTLALVARASAFSFGLVYGSFKLKYLKMKANSQRKAEAKAHH
ncbi:hypothetical protein HRI_004025500 [Hibiscus trionum]|uniref:ATP synthase subunit e, mitochondrial n=1 Tax=Hibiscus trionum TaxID=183268 RepID=A0A9W7MGP6_HIBTR|nr:hypothetical protein HRI_004025500 [Hibiscus trionum]